jgi:phosphoribosylanthranilate isomerase
MSRVKICGVTRLEDAVLAAELGASAIGFVFWPHSLRCIDPFRARRIAAALPPFVTPVGVFVDQPIEYVQAVANLVPLGAVQLHGDEPLAHFAALRRRIIKALPVGPDFAPATVAALPPAVTALLDARDPVARGGTGRAIDWELAAAAARLRPLILAGGLDAQNVAAAIGRVRPYGIDVSSGVEVEPGVKDAARLRALFAALPGGPIVETLRG